MSSQDKRHISYSPVSGGSKQLPCIQRFTSHRWKLGLLVVIVVVEACIIFLYTGTTCINAPLAPQAIIREKSLMPETTLSYEDAREPHGKHSRRRFPHFLIIGVKKSGTRALLNFINMHPDIMTSSREVHFFDKNETYNKGMEWYRKQMPYSYPEQLTGEKSPGYFRASYAPERVHLMNDSIKLIMVVREPIERCMSNYLQHANGIENFPSFESQVLLANGEVNPNSPHIYNSDYSRYIDNWLKWFHREQIKVLDGNLLITDPHLVMQEVQEFLGVKQFIDDKFFQFDEEKGFYCYYNHSTALRCLGDSKGRPHPPIDPATKRKLYEYFAPRNKMFFQKINRTFQWDVEL